MTSTSDSQRPADWTPKQRFKALMQSAGLDGQSLNAFCRKQSFITSNSSPSPATDTALRTDLNQVKKKLNRKEKALAERQQVLNYFAIACLNPDKPNGISNDTAH